MENNKSGTDFLNNIFDRFKKVAELADAKKQQEQQKQKGKMMKISDLAKELGVSSSDIINFLREKDSFAFSKSSGVNGNAAIDNFWESKVRNHFGGETDKSDVHPQPEQHKPASKKVFIGDLAAELGIDREIIRNYLMKNYPREFRYVQDTYSIGEPYLSKIRTNPAFKYSRKPAETKTSKQSTVSTSILDADTAKEDKKVERKNVSTSIIDGVPAQQPTTQQTLQCEKISIDELSKYLGVEQQRIRDYLTANFPVNFRNVTDAYSIQEPFISNVRKYFKDQRQGKNAS